MAGRRGIGDAAVMVTTSVSSSHRCVQPPVMGMCAPSFANPGRFEAPLLAIVSVSCGH